ncbi:amidohydrolase [Chaetoceros tenuissimus]|uniref:Amidohydrolase n=1 Tax=Chaetoceros tenuissimus TaxID=426638 RepID=A0AAD3CLB7_9STRA|nr:amidohydrolase [Chaetoceros tenuissimus]
MMNKARALSPVLILMHLLGYAWADEYFVLGNTKVHTVDKSKPQAEAIAIDENGVIAAVGSDEEVRNYVNQMNGVMDYIDLNGKLILPGFQDSHIHVVEAGIYADVCYVPEETSLANIPSVIRNCEMEALLATKDGLSLQVLTWEFLWETFIQAKKEKAYTSLKNALVQLKENGITTVSDAGGFWRQAQTEAWTRAEADGILTVRASNAYYVYPDQSLESQRLPEKLSNNPDSLVRFDHVKIYVDGIPSLGTAALHEDYLPAMELPQGEERGFEYFGNAETLNTVSKTLSDAGFQLFFHTCGDRAVTLALDAIEHANPTKQARVTHNYFVSENENRFKSLNVVADFQLAPSSVDLSYQNFLASTVVGSSRAAKVLPALELYNAGANITLSSDWDADVLSPLVKMKTVLNRPGGRSLPNLETVIEMMTLNPAKLLNHADKTGSIEVGKYADLAILDRDIFQIPTSQIDGAKVVATLLQGEVIYDLNNVFVNASAGRGIGSLVLVVGIVAFFAIV